MDPQHVWQYHPSALRRTRPWPWPSDQEEGGVDGRLPAALALSGCDGWCAAPRDESLLVLSVPGIPPGGCLGCASSDDLHTEDGWWCVET